VLVNSESVLFQQSQTAVVTSTKAEQFCL